MIMQKTPDDYNIHYIPYGIDITDIWEFGYTDIIDGFGITNKVESKIIIKIVFIDKDGKMRVIEDSSSNFVFTPKEVDKEQAE